MIFKSIISVCLLLLAYPGFCQQQKKLFELLPQKETGVNFINQLSETEQLNVLAYEYLYNGGGVAAGDLNNDGLPDLYFTGNMKPNKLFLNLGNFKFKDIARQSGTAGKQGWKTGVSLADVNADGLLDIYVCYSGNNSELLRQNELYINNGDLTFTEKAAAYGINDPGYSTHAVFFDYDRDGDVDLYVLNHSIKDFKDFELKYLKTTYDSLAGDRLFRNDDGKHFTDVTREAKIPANPLSFGLGVAVSDINNDGWPDLYVSNDYREHDYLLINNHDGTFTDQVHSALGHISEFSMGNAISDFNNDGLVDIFTLDMLPEDNQRQKLLQGPENYELYIGLSQSGFHHQFMRNMLHLNNGDQTFSEIGQLAGISNTDWSWAPLFADFDNDGFKDLFVTNGYFRDYTNKDFLKFWGDYIVQKAVRAEPTHLIEVVTKMPSTKVHNYIFRNRGNLTFADETSNWGFAAPVLSNGAAYADLDNDGDLDLVINNINEQASIYKNLVSDELHNNYLRIKLIGTGGNKFGLGAKVYVYQNGSLSFSEQMPTQGYQSTVTEIPTFGLGKAKLADSVKVVWPDGTFEIKFNLQANNTHEFKQASAGADKKDLQPVKAKWFQKINSPVPFVHKEYAYNDFKRQPLMPFMITKCSPVFAKADVNKDGREDIFIGSAKLQAAKLFLQQADGTFQERPSPDWEKDRVSTDADARFFDADGDGDQDLFVVSGSYADYQENDFMFADRLYLNDGAGNFRRSVESLPGLRTSKSCVRSLDFDGDGDLDVFLGGRVIPGKYPQSPASYILQNNGKGMFSDITASVAPAFQKLGMITDAAWVDVNGDGRPELMVGGEAMPLRAFSFNGSQFEEVTSKYFDKSYSGFWNVLLADDLDGDGDTDLVAGNLGTNTQIKASDAHPAEIVSKDFDGNGSIDPFLCFYIQGKSYPYVSRDELLEQMYPMRKKFTSYASYANVTLSEIFGEEALKDADRLPVNHLETGWFENVNGRFVWHSLPVQAQFSPVYAIVAKDLNADGRKDLLLLGNNDFPRLKLGKLDANFGTLFTGQGSGFEYVPQPISGLSVKGDVKDACVLETGQGSVLLIGLNNKAVEAYQLIKQK